MSVGLPADIKGTHLSRFVELLHENADELTQRTIPDVAGPYATAPRDAEAAKLTVGFPYFMARSAPITGATALMDYVCHFHSTRRRHQSHF